jgi:hypothetical protein
MLAYIVVVAGLGMLASFFADPLNQSWPCILAEIDSVNTSQWLADGGGGAGGGAAGAFDNAEPLRSIRR